MRHAPDRRDWPHPPRGVALINRISPVRGSMRGSARTRPKTRAGVRHVELKAENRDGAAAARRAPRCGPGSRAQSEEQRQQFIGAAPIRSPAQFVVDEPADEGLIVAAASPHRSRARSRIWRSKSGSNTSGKSCGGCLSPRRRCPRRTTCRDRDWASGRAARAPRSRPPRRTRSRAY